jgi:hypothetical protein
MATRTAVVHTDTTAIAHTGRAFTLPAGEYPVVDIDGADERGVRYLDGPDDALVCVSGSDPNITYRDGSE